MSTFSVRRVPGDLTVHPLLGHIVSHKLQNPVGSAWFPPLHHRSENSLLCWLQSRGCRAGAVPGGQPSLSVTLIGAETAATELQLSSSLLRQETFGTSLPQWESCPLQESLRTSPSWYPPELRLHLQEASSTPLTWGSVCSLPSVLRCTPYFFSASLASL